MPEILWTTPRPSEKKLHQPEGPSSYYLDAYAADDLSLARRIWSEFGGAISRVREIDRRNWLSSWNWWPGALAASILAASDRGARGRQALLVEKLIRYCQSQLNRVSPRHDLWGAETLSRLYCWPVSVMALLHDWAKDNNVEAAVGPLTDLLRAHAYTLALFTLPDPYPDSEANQLFLCAPGMRSHKFHKGQIISFITACVLNAANVRDRPRVLEAAAKPAFSILWPGRVAWRARHEYLSEDERGMLMRHVRNGDQAPEIVKVLNSLGVELRSSIQVWRYQSGDYVALARNNVQGSTPPIMAMSRVDGEYWPLDVHPRGFRGEGGRRLGHPSKCWREAAQVRVVFRNAVLGGNAEPKDLEDSIPSPIEGGKILFAARFGRKGPDNESVWVMTEETREQEEKARDGRILRDAQRIGELAAGRPDRGIARHGQAIGRLAAGSETGGITLRARAIARIGARRQDEEEIYLRSQRIIETSEWWL